MQLLLCAPGPGAGVGRDPVPLPVSSDGILPIYNVRPGYLVGTLAPRVMMGTVPVPGTRYKKLGKDFQSYGMIECPIKQIIKILREHSRILI